MLLKSSEKNYHPIDTTFCIQTELLHLDVKEVDTSHFFCKGVAGNITIFCPQGTQFDSLKFQRWFRKVVREVLRRQAKIIFPNRLAYWMQSTGLRCKHLSIKSTKTKWGSYSSLGNMNLSLYLLLLPQQYVDYTICHELCHSKEMNHSKQFWSLLNTFLNGKARKFHKDMNEMVRKWYEEKDPRFLLISNV